MRWVLVAASVFLSEPRRTDDSWITCIGEGSRAVVYLHGIDSSPPSPQERDNRKALAAWARTYDLRVALPRSRISCPNQWPGALCWGWTFDAHERFLFAEAIRDAASVCLPPHVSYGVIGFSNGGYAITDLLARGEIVTLLPDARWVITVGASKVEGRVAAPRLTDQPPLTMLSGDEDTWNFDPSDHYAAALREAGARVESRHFHGAHRLADAPVGDALDQLLTGP